jgi:hypothetical protein
MVKLLTEKKRSPGSAGGSAALQEPANHTGEREGVIGSNLKAPGLPPTL